MTSDEGAGGKAPVPSEEDRSNAANVFGADRPIAKPEFDRFGRAPFALAVADLLINGQERDGLVIGIYGQWGDGKTSVLNLVRGYLGDQKGIKYIPFAPWLVRSAEQMLPALMATIDAALGVTLWNRARRAAGTFGEYAELAGKLDSRLGAAAKGLQLVSTTSIDKRREAIGKHLADRGLRLVIGIDDVDRLDAEEMAAILKLVKLTADFPYVSYLLALDDRVVSKALARSYGDENDGAAFLGKIVQVPLHLPPPEFGTLTSFALERIQEVVDDLDVAVPPNIGQELGVRFSLHIGEMLATARDAVRLANGVRFAASALRNEVNFSDLVALVALRLFVPDLYRALPGTRGLLLGAYRIGRSEQEIKDELEALLQRSAMASGEVRPHGESLVRELFPFLREAAAGRSRQVWDAAKFDREQRVAGPRYFERYFTYHLGRDDVADAEVAAIIDEAMHGGAIARMTQLLLAGKGMSLVEGIRQRASELSPSQASELARALAQLAPGLPRPDIFFDVQTPYVQAAIAIRQLIERLPEGGSRDAAAIDCIARAAEVPFVVTLGSWLGSSDDPILSLNGRQRVLAEVVQRIANTANTGAPLYERFARDSSLIFSVWSEFGEPGATNTYVQRTMAERPENSLSFIATFAPYTFSAASRILSDLSEREYGLIARIVEPEQLATSVRRALGNPAIPKEFPRTFGNATPADLGRQFLFLDSGRQSLPST